MITFFKRERALRGGEMPGGGGGMPPGRGGGLPPGRGRSEGGGGAGDRRYNNRLPVEIWNGLKLRKRNRKMV